MAWGRKLGLEGTIAASWCTTPYPQLLSSSPQTPSFSLTHFRTSKKLVQQNNAVWRKINLHLLRLHKIWTSRNKNGHHQRRNVRWVPKTGCSSCKFRISDLCAAALTTLLWKILLLTSSVWMIFKVLRQSRHSRGELPNSIDLNYQ